MLRIGIIGTENSHAMAFSRIINLPDPETGKMLYPDVRVVGVYGPDTDSANAIVAQAGAEFVAGDPSEFFGKVDSMIICNRKGSLHAKYAMPFIEKGMPLFIDKPFTSCVESSNELAAAAKKYGSKLCGGSGCKLAYDTVLLKNKVKNLVKSGDMITGCINYAADPDSEYDGFYFYSPHLTEIALEVFGKDVQSIKAFEKNGSRVCVWRYADFDVTLNYTKGTHTSTAVLFAKTGPVVRDIDTSLIYYHEVEHYAAMLRGGDMPQTYDELVLPVRVISAVEESVKTGSEVNI